MLVVENDSHCISKISGFISNELIFLQVISLIYFNLLCTFDRSRYQILGIFIFVDVLQKLSRNSSLFYVT